MIPHTVMVHKNNNLFTKAAILRRLLAAILDYEDHFSRNEVLDLIFERYDQNCTKIYASFGFTRRLYNLGA